MKFKEEIEKELTLIFQDAGYKYASAKAILHQQVFTKIFKQWALELAPKEQDDFHYNEAVEDYKKKIDESE